MPDLSIDQYGCHLMIISQLKFVRNEKITGAIPTKTNICKILFFTNELNTYFDFKILNDRKFIALKKYFRRKDGKFITYMLFGYLRFERVQF